MGHTKQSLDNLQFPEILDVSDVACILASRLVAAMLLAIMLLNSGGCGVAKKPSVQTDASQSANDAAPVSEASADSLSDPRNQVSSSSNSESVAPEVTESTFDAELGQPPSDLKAASAEPTTGQAASESNQTVAPSEVSRAVASPPVASPPVAKPTPEQLARWQRATFEPLQLLACREPQGTGFASLLAHAPDGRTFVTAGNQVVLWSVAEDKPQQVLAKLGDGQTFKSLAVAPDGKWCAAGDSEGTLRIWNLADRSELISKKLGSSGLIQVAVSPDSKQIATISYDNEVSLWSADRLEPQSQFKVTTNGLKRIAFMTNELLVAAGESTTSWNVRTGSIAGTFAGARYNFTMGLSPDASHFLFGDKDSLQIWNISTKKPAAALRGGFATEELVSFSADGKHLATANGSAVRLWDIASGQLVQVIDTFGWPITGLSWLPESDLLAISSLNSRLRLWGSTLTGKSLGLVPMHAPASLPDSAVREPATAWQLQPVIDLRTFPRLPGGTVSASDAFNLSHEADVGSEEAKQFYAYQLAKAGWEQARSVADAASTLRFAKQGCMLTASFYESAPSKTYISVNFAGNFDLRWLPKFDDEPTEMMFENEDSVNYRTRANLIDIETSLLKKMHAAGWTAYARLHSSHSEVEDVRDMEFLRGGTTVRVSIRRQPTDPSSYTIQYGRFLTMNAMPIPADAGFVELDVSTKPLLVASTNLDLTQATKFYDAELAAQGWLARSTEAADAKDQRWRSYVREQQDLTVGLMTLPTGKTLVRIGEDLEKSSWQLAAPEVVASEATAANVPAVGIDAIDFPLMKDAQSVKFDPIAKSLEFSVAQVPLLDAAEFYTQKMTSLGWQLDGPGIKADDYVFLTFEKETEKKDTVEIELRARIANDLSTINVQGDGLQWDKPLPGGDKLISYEAWLRQHKHPATLDLLDSYRQSFAPK